MLFCQLRKNERRIKSTKIRLSGIDAPEKKQYCNKNFLNIYFFIFEKKYNCGIFVKKKLINKTKNKKIKCFLEGEDFFKRHLGTCYLNKENINAWMVKNGYAVSFKKYSKKYIFLEEYAKENKLGIWNGSFIRPYKWRKENLKK